MKDRLELLLAKRLSSLTHGKPWPALQVAEQREIRNRIHREISRELWIGTFHALFSRLLRFDIDKFKDPEGLTWTKPVSYTHLTLPTKA